MPDDLMTILALPQGRYRDLEGMTLVDALVMFCEDDARFLRAHPSCAQFFRPSWSVHHLPPGQHPRLGDEWYLAAESDGLLSIYEFNHDSSD